MRNVCCDIWDLINDNVFYKVPVASNGYTVESEIFNSNILRTIEMDVWDQLDEDFE